MAYWVGGWKMLSLNHSFSNTNRSVYRLSLIYTVRMVVVSTSQNGWEKCVPHPSNTPSITGCDLYRSFFFFLKCYVIHKLQVANEML